MSAELEAHKVELADAKKQLSDAQAKTTGAGTTTARPHKPALFSGKPGTI